MPWICLIGAKGLEGQPINMLDFHGKPNTLMAVFLQFIILLISKGNLQGEVGVFSSDVENEN